MMVENVDGREVIKIPASFASVLSLNRLLILS